MAKNGDVEYIIRADDSKVESDLSDANKKVKKASEKSADETVKIEEQKTKDIKKEQEKTVDNAEKAADDVTDAWKDAGQDAKKAMSDIADEDVNFDVDADTGKAESAIKNVSQDQSIDVDVDADTSGAKSSIEELGDAGEEAAGQIGQAFSDSDFNTLLGNIGGTAKDSFGEAATAVVPFSDKIAGLATGLSGTAAMFLGIGGAFLGVGALSVGVADDMQSAMNQFTSATGASKEETERYQQVLENIYGNNYGESFTDIADAMATVKQNLGDLDDESLQEITESAFALRDTFEYDVTESTRAAKAMMDNFGISGEDAMSMIAAGAQNGLDYSGELLDSISEYSVQFGKVGLDADDMFKIMEKGAESGAFNLDKVGDAVKEMSIRVIDGSETTKEGFATLGLDADEMAGKFAAGGDTAKEAFNQTIDALASMEDPIEQNAAGVALFGTMWEDLGPEAVTALADIEDGAYDTKGAMDQIKEVKYDDLGAMFEALKRQIELVALPLGEALIPLLEVLLESVLPVVTELLGPLVDLFSQLIVPIAGLISTAITPLIDVFKTLMDIAIRPLVELIQTYLLPIFSGSLTSMFSTASSTMNSIIGVFKGIISFIRNVFTGNWRGAWQAVKSIFSSIISGLAGIFKAPINAIISGINTFIGGLNKIKIPDWVPGVGGKSFNIPKIPRLKVGMDYVPSDFFPALLDEGEMVLTKAEAEAMRSLGGVEGVLGLLGTVGMADQSIAQKSGESFNYKRLGKMLDRFAQEIEKPIYLDSRKINQAGKFKGGVKL